jgi:hypothetical protein
MNSVTMKLPLSLLASLSLVFTYGESRTSANYSLTTETQDFAGERVTSASYRLDATAGSAGATASSDTGILHHGFAGQLAEYATLVLHAELNSVAEGATRPLSAFFTLDDATLVFLPVSQINWTVQNAPEARISADGLFVAGPVLSDTIATVIGSYGGLLGTLDLTVINVRNDGFGAPELEPNPPMFSPVFRMIIAVDSSQPSFLSIVFGPLSPELVYTVETSYQLGAEANWRPLTNFNIRDANGLRTVTDTSPPIPTRFYRVRMDRAAAKDFP